MTSGCTPSYIAAQQGHLEVVRFLCDVGAEKIQAMNDGLTQLYIYIYIYIASELDHREVALTQIPLYGSSLSSSILSGWQSIRMCYLIQAYCLNSNIRITSNLTTLRALHCDQAGKVPLSCMQQAQAGTDAVEQLRWKHADPNATDVDGSTPLCAASELDHLEVVRFHCDIGAERNQAMTVGRTPLCIASH